MKLLVTGGLGFIGSNFILKLLKQSNEFEIITPQIYTNVESLRLLNIKLPNQLYNISENLQNNIGEKHPLNIKTVDQIKNISQEEKTVHKIKPQDLENKLILDNFEDLIDLFN